MWSEITFQDVRQLGRVNAPALQIIDNSDAGFSSVGGWTLYVGIGRNNTMHYIYPGTGAAVATWTFAVAPSTYNVSCTWTPYVYRASNAPFKIYDAETLKASLAVNQKLAPASFSDDGSNWHHLGSVMIAGNSLIVTLDNSGDDMHVADAIRISTQPNP